MRKLLTLIFLNVLATAPMAEEMTLQYCKNAMNKSSPIWHKVPLNKELLNIKKNYKYDPTVAFGDFDNDNKNDIALLVEQSRPKKKIRAIAVCLSSEKSKTPQLITNLYVDEQINTTPKGTKHYNIETGKKDTYNIDGISVTCCECCGATYIYGDGKFKQVVDGD